MFGDILAKPAGLQLQRKRIALFDSLKNPSYYNQTALLLHFEGGSIVDSGKNNLAITVHGDAYNDTSIYKIGSSSLALDGTGDYLTVSDSALVIGTQDFTIHFWANFHTLPSDAYLFDSRSASGTSSGFGIAQKSGGIFYVYDGSNSFDSTVSFAVDTWAHVEVGRRAGQLFMFLNGLTVKTASLPNNFASSSWLIGAVQFNPPGILASNGHIDEFQAIIGACVHTADFTPPTGQY